MFKEQNLKSLVVDSKLCYCYGVRVLSSKECIDHKWSDSSSADTDIESISSGSSLLDAVEEYPEVPNHDSGDSSSECDILLPVAGLSVSFDLMSEMAHIAVSIDNVDGFEQSVDWHVELNYVPWVPDLPVLEDVEGRNDDTEQSIMAGCWEVCYNTIDDTKHDSLCEFRFLREDWVASDVVWSTLIVFTSIIDCAIWSLSSAEVREVDLDLTKQFWFGLPDC